MWNTKRSTEKKVWNEPLCHKYMTYGMEVINGKSDLGGNRGKQLVEGELR